MSVPTYAHETIVERKGEDIRDRQVAEVLMHKSEVKKEEVKEEPKEEPKEPNILGKLVQELDSVVRKLNDRAD